MWAATKRMAARAAAPGGAIIGGALALRVIYGVGFANYDTLYALAWGGQLARGETPAYGVPIAPTPHPLVELLGVVLYPLGPHAAETVAVALGYLALSACGWVIYLLGREWFGARRGRPGGRHLPHPRTGDLLRRAGLRGRPLPAGGAGSTAAGDTPAAGGGAGAGALALAGLLRPEAWGVLRPVPGLPGGRRALTRAARPPLRHRSAARRARRGRPRVGAPHVAGGNWEDSRCWRPAPRWFGS